MGILFMILSVTQILAMLKVQAEIA